MVQLSHPYMATEKNHSFDYTDLCQQSVYKCWQYFQNNLKFCKEFDKKMLENFWWENDSKYCLEKQSGKDGE